MSNRKAQNSKVQRDSKKLSKMIDRYYALNFEQFLKEFKVVNSIFYYQTSTSRYSILNEAIN